jgi:hypothetical protein
MEKKVSASLTFEDRQKLITPNGLDWSQDFKDKIYDKEEEFRERIILEINEFAGDDWAVQFNDFGSLFGSKFIVDIRVSNSNLLLPITQVIINAFPEMDFSFYALGQHSPFHQTPYFMYERP